jgi:predicted transcriptional regulator of viral defense system
MRCYSRDDIVKLTGGTDAANALIYSYKRKGLIKSVHRDLFVTVSLETNQPAVSRFTIASNAAPDAAVTHHSAFEYYGYANQVLFEMYVASGTRFRSFEFDGILYLRVPKRIDQGIEMKDGGIRVTGIERAVIDSIKDFERIGGLEELLRCLELVPYLSADKLSEYLKAYDMGVLYQKTGYILSHFKDALYLPSSFFEYCKSMVPRAKRYLWNGLQRETHILDSDWGLYVPVDLLSATREGNTENETI